MSGEVGAKKYVPTWEFNQRMTTLSVPLTVDNVREVFVGLIRLQHETNPNSRWQRWQVRRKINNVRRSPQMAAYLERVWSELDS